MISKAIFTHTPGRSGTLWLCTFLRKNLPWREAMVCHERAGYKDWGENSPEVGVMLRFNMEGPEDVRVAEFWKRKLDNVAETEGARVYAETAHFLSKGGLIEHLDVLTSRGIEVHIVHLWRDLARQMISMELHADFVHQAYVWQFYLAPNYASAIVDFKPFEELATKLKGTQQSNERAALLWYLCEMARRAEKYREAVAEDPLIHWHDCRLEHITKHPETLLEALGEPIPDEGIENPPPQNTTKDSAGMKGLEVRLTEQAEELVKLLKQRGPFKRLYDD